MRMPDDFNAFGADYLPGAAGIVIRAVNRTPARAEAAMPVHRGLMAPNDCLHGGAIMVLADTTAGYGAIACLPEGASGFLTQTMSSSHLSAVRDGTLRCVAVARHLGRTTQVWDAELVHEDSGRLVALFRCTQLLLYPGAR